MNDSMEETLNQMKRDYELWKTTLTQGEGLNDNVELPQSDFELLHAIDAKEREKLSKLSTPIWDRVMRRLWPTSAPGFLRGVVAHSTRLLEDHRNIVHRIWNTVGLVLERPGSYDDIVLETMFSWVEDLLPRDIRAPIASAYRIFVRDFLLEIALVEGVKYELDTPGPDQPCLILLHRFVDAKTMPQLRGRLPEHQWDDTKAEIEAGLLGYGLATSLWSKRKTIREYDRALSSLGAFIAKTAAFVIKDVLSSQVYYRIDGDIPTGLPTPLRDGLASLNGKMWHTRGGLSKALKSATPALLEPENRCWYEEVLEYARVEKEHGVGGAEEDDRAAEINAIPDTRNATGDISLEVLCSHLVDADRFATFLGGWKQLSPKERQRLSDKFILLKTLILSETIDDLCGAYSAPEGCPQLKCLLLQGISALAFGAAGGDTAHRWIHSDDSGAIHRDTIAAMGFSKKTLTELTTGVDSETDWNLWRLVYTISFVSALYRIDDLLQTILEERIDIYLTSEGECQFPVPKLLACLLKKNREQQLNEEQIAELIDTYNECLCQFTGRVASVHEDADILSIRMKREGIAARTAYPHVLLAGYAPNAFTTLYWNLHQGKQLSIDSMRGKQKDLRNSLASLRRFLS